MTYLKHDCVVYAKVRVSIVQLRCVGSSLTISRSVHILEYSVRALQNLRF